MVFVFSKNLLLYEFYQRQFTNCSSNLSKEFEQGGEQLLKPGVQMPEFSRLVCGKEANDAT